ncbi:MAG TPA: dTDP-4-dehydrorhamnose 3,5-epimerase [Edaphocola sp.]|nr:dTDP-4-dehydrorhamnose 3,5-epimerase [Edaphocola sp.]
MTIDSTPFEGCFIFTPDVFRDSRGYFFESFNERQFEEISGIKVSFVQDNQSFSKYGTIRGLHFQKGEFEQAKLVRVIKGEIFDVAVDLRPESPSYLKWFGLVLSEDNNKQLFIPKGFAHGFSVLSQEAIVLYKCDNFYNKEAEAGILYDDPTFNIDWQIALKDRVLSDRDLKLPFFKI